MGAAALRFQAMTVTRTGAIRYATWDEFDLERGVCGGLVNIPGPLKIPRATANRDWLVKARQRTPRLGPFKNHPEESKIPMVSLEFRCKFLGGSLGGTPNSAQVL